MSSIKVLLVEDDERLAQLTARYLESHGVLVTIAVTGTEGQLEALRRQYDCIVLDVMLPGRDGIEVTAYEFSILRALARRPGKVLSREQLLDLAKGSADLSFDRSIDVHVSRLRAKLGDDSRNPKILKTVRGAGYLLVGGDP